MVTAHLQRPQSDHTSYLLKILCLELTYKNGKGLGPNAITNAHNNIMAGIRDYIIICDYSLAVTERIPNHVTCMQMGWATYI